MTLFIGILVFLGVLVALTNPRTPQKSSILFRCPHCGREYRGLSAAREYVDHLWEDHQHPAELTLNGRTFRSGPTPILDRFVLRVLAERRASR